MILSVFGGGVSVLRGEIASELGGFGVIASCVFGIERNAGLSVYTYEIAAAVIAYGICVDTCAI